MGKMRADEKIAGDGEPVAGGERGGVEGFEPAGEVKATTPSAGEIKLRDVVEAVEKGGLAIPQFQRAYVWKKSNCAKLFDSIFKGYPIGTLTLWSTTERLSMVKRIANRTFPVPKPGYPVNYVLDGQQRVTSIYACVNGLEIDNIDYSEVYLLLHDQTSEENELVIEKTGKLDPDRYISICDLYGKPISSLMQRYSPESFVRIINFREILNTYPIPKIEFNAASLGEATDIFTRINTTGKKLTAFAVVCAKVYDEKRFDLLERREKQREIWEKKGFGTIPDYTVLQALSLCVRKGCTREDVLKLTLEDMTENWDKVNAAFDLAIDHLKSYFSICASALMPYDVLIIPFVYFFFRNGKSSVSENQQRRLADYFWRTALSQRFSNAVATKLSSDVGYLEEILKDAANPDDSRLPSVNISADYVKDNGAFDMKSAFAKALMCILAEQIPLGFRNGNRVIIDNSNLSPSNTKNCHHFFPKAYMRKCHKEIPAKQVNHMANITLVDRTLNQGIGDTAPSVYMADFSRENRKMKETMESHLIGDFVEYGIADDDYRKFFARRIERFCEKLRRKIIPRHSDTIDKGRGYGGAGEKEGVQLTLFPDERCGVADDCNDPFSKDIPTAESKIAKIARYYIPKLFHDGRITEDDIAYLTSSRAQKDFGLGRVLFAIKEFHGDPDECKREGKLRYYPNIALSFGGKNYILTNQWIKDYKNNLLTWLRSRGVKI